MVHGNDCYVLFFENRQQEETVKEYCIRKEKEEYENEQKALINPIEEEATA